MSSISYNLPSQLHAIYKPHYVCEPSYTFHLSDAGMQQAVACGPLRLTLPMTCLIFLAFCLLLTAPLSAADGAFLSPTSSAEVMSPNETEAVYQMLEAINSETAWRTLYPGNLCMEGPHGLVCGTDEFNVLHVVELNLGWVSDANNNAQCGQNASISRAVLCFPYLRKLFFYSCFTQSEVVLPSFLWSLGSSLEELVFLRNSRLVGNLPKDIAKLGNMKRLIMVGNALQGSIPTQLGELSGLLQLVLSRNQFTGKIPDSLGGMKKLRIVDLSWNMVDSGIPASIVSGMHRLQKLDLSHNNLGGSVPACIGEAMSLKLLDLSWNKLSGALPNLSLGRLTRLRVLQLGHNSFNGSALSGPMWVNMSCLVGVGMAQAGLGGRIPMEMGQLRNLRHLDLSGNMLEGAIPESLGRLPSIFEMDLSGNRLQGVLPFSLEFVTHMGRNLRVVNNDGLCSRPEINSSLLSTDAGLPVCDHHALFLTSQALELSSQRGFVRNSASSLKSGTVPSLLLAVLLSLAVVLI